MNILAWAVLGLVAGALAKMIYPGTQGGGWFSTIALGIVGAFIGGTLFTFINTGKFALVSATALSPGAFWMPMLFAVLGSMVAIFLWGLITGNA